MSLSEKKNKQVTSDGDLIGCNREQCEILSGLVSTLSVYNFYNGFDKILAEAEKEIEAAGKEYRRLKSNKRFDIYMRAVFNRISLLSRYKNINIVEIENKLKEYEKFLDRKYWNEEALDALWIILEVNIESTIERAVEFYEKHQR